MQTQDEIRAFLVTTLAKILKVGTDDISMTITFDRFGLDSAGAFKMTGEINKRYEVDFEPTLLYDYPTVDDLAGYLSSQIQG